MIIMLGTSTDTKGGVATVIQSYKDANLFIEQNILYLPTHKDGTIVLKLNTAIVAVFSFVSKLFSAPIELVHIHSASRASFYRKSIFIVLAWLFKKPIVFHLHGAEFKVFFEEESSPLKKRMIRRVLGLCDVVIVLSEQWKQWMSGLTESNKIYVVHNTLPVDAQAKAKTLDPQPLILFLGRVGARKGVHDLLDACEQLRQKTSFTMKIAGDGEVSKFRQLAAEKGLSGTVSFLGWIGPEEKAQLLDAANVLTLPSYNEGLPMSVVEALTHGIPVVATSVGGIPDIIEPGKNGFLIEPGNTAALTENLYRVISNPDDYHRMSQYALDHMRQKFSMEHTKRELIKIYDGLR